MTTEYTSQPEAKPEPPDLKLAGESLFAAISDEVPQAIRVCLVEAMLHVLAEGDDE